jgi:hypothetical protein
MLKENKKKIFKITKIFRNNNLLSGKHGTLKTRQTYATGAGFTGVEICEPTRDRDYP